jgi:hypothetical protein
VTVRLARLGRTGGDALQGRYVDHLGRIGQAVERELARPIDPAEKPWCDESYCATLIAEMSRVSLTRFETRKFPLPSRDFSAA